MLITIAGPGRAGFIMNALRVSLTQSGFPVRICQDVALSDIRDVEATEVLVPIAVDCGRREIERMTRVRGIVSPLLGYEWIDVAAATERNIPVINGEVEENRASMAEATIMLLLSLLYRFKDTENPARRGQPGGMERTMLLGKAVGIIGYGGISRTIIERLEPFGCSIVVHTQNPPSERSGKVQFPSLERLLRQSDAVLLMTSLTDRTRHILGRKELGNIKQGAVLVNTARGGLIDEDALADVLRSGAIAAAAVDVFEREPLPLDSPLLALPNVTLTPHAIGHTRDAFEAMIRAASEHILSLLKGEIPRSRCNAVSEAGWLKRFSKEAAR